MARVILPRALAAELFGGRETVEVTGKTLFGVVHALEALGPGFEARAGHGLAMAVDGMLAEDWSTPVGPDSEVLVVMRVAGGEASA
jgi:molybdopterin converting factor small subunit